MMKKPYLIAAIVSVVILLGAGGWYLQSKKGGGGEAILETGKEEASLPFSTNPLDDKPNINPADQANPFKNIKTNPFE